MRHAWLPGNPSYYYIDMEYCPRTLQEWINALEFPFIQFTSNLQADSLLAVLRIVKDIVCGLAYIHGKGVVHRDLKPPNGT